MGMLACLLSGITLSVVVYKAHRMMKILKIKKEIDKWKALHPGINVD